MQDILLSFGLIILLGISVRRLRPGGLDADLLRQAINVCVLNVFLPALCVKTLYRAPVDIDAVLVPATAGATTLLSLLIAAATYTLLKKQIRLLPAEQGALLLAASFGNVTYLGLPVLAGLFGNDAARYALFYDLLATTPLLWLVGASVASRYGEGRRLDIRESVKVIASLPPVWGIGVGMAMSLINLRLPRFAVLTLDMLGGLVVPLMIFSIGLALSIPRVTHAYAIIPAVIIKLAVSPLLAFATAKLLGLSGIALASCAIEGAMPAMVLSLLIAARFRLDVALSAFVIVITTILSFFTLPVVVSLMN